MSSADQTEKITFFIYIVAIVASLGGLLFGFDIGGSGGTFVMKDFRSHFLWPPLKCPHATDELCVDYNPDAGTVKRDKALTTAIFSLSAMVGALGAGTLADLFGRKLSIMINSLTFTVGAILQSSAPKIWVFLIGRAVAGYAVGQLFTVVPMYQSEAAPAHVRGLIGTFQQIALTFGLFLAAVVNIGLKEFSWGWRLSFSFNGFVSFVMFCCMFILPESPRYLVSKGRTEDAGAILQKLRTGDSLPELNTIVEYVAREHEFGNGSWAELFSNKNNMRYRTLLGCFLQFSQSMTGIYAVSLFGPSLFGMLFSETVSLLGNVGLQGADFLATFICLYLVDRTGRITLLLVGAVGMLIGALAVALLTSPLFDYKDSSSIGILVIIACIFYITNFAYSWGPIVWVACAEFYPDRLRGKALSLSTATNWSFAALAGFIIPYMNDPKALDLYGTFLFFSAWIVIIFLGTYFFCPETAGYSLGQTDQLFEEFTPSIRRKLTFSLKASSSSMPSDEKHP